MRRRTIGEGEDEDVREWQLIEEKTIDADAKTISIDLNGEYEELDILFWSCAAETANDNIVNPNGTIRFISNTGKEFVVYMNSISYKGDIKRLRRISCRCFPYFWVEHIEMNCLSLESFSNGQYINHPGGGLYRNFGKVKSFTIKASDDGVLGSGTTVAVYGR